MAKTIFIDESGYTGFDLINPDQPFFCVASTDMGSRWAQQVLARCFPKHRAAEFKFTNIRKRATHRGGLIRLGEAIAADSRHFHAFLVDKKFSILSKLVDFLVEPVFAQSGLNFYAENYNRRYTNTFALGLSSYSTPLFYQTVIATYHTFSRHPSPASLQQMQAAFSQMARECAAEIQPFMDHVRYGAEHFLEFHDLDDFENTNEIQLSVVLSVVVYWRQQTCDDLHVIHDSSSNFFRQADIWRFITDGQAPPQEIIGGWPGIVHFPLRVTRTTAGNSANHSAIQLCDLVAGFVSWAKRPELSADDVRLRDEALAAGFGEINLISILPGHEYIEGLPPVGPNPVDQFLRVLRRNHE